MEEVEHPSVFKVQAKDICSIYNEESYEHCKRLFRKIVNVYIAERLVGCSKDRLKTERQYIIKYTDGSVLEWKGWLKEAAMNLKRQHTWREGGALEILETIIRF